MHAILLQLPEIIKGMPEIIKGIFDILDLLVFRLTLLGLAIIGAYTLIRGHLH